MFSNSRLLRGCAAAAALFALAGCSNSNSSNGAGPNQVSSGTPTNGAPAAAPAGAPSYMLITNGLSPFWDAMTKGMNDEGAKLKVNVSWQGPNPSDSAHQISIFHDAMAKGVDGIGMSSVDPSAITPLINQAVGQGVPVISFDSDAANSKRLAYVGTNNYEAGFKIGQYVKTLFPNGGKLVAFVGTMSQENAIDRYRGLQDALKGTNITFLAPPLLDNQDKTKAQTNVQDAVQRYQGQGLNGLVGLYSYDGPAILNVVKQENLLGKIKVICFDGDPETLAGLKDGTVDVTVVQKPYMFGKISILLLNYLHQDHNNIDQAFQQIAPEIKKLGMTMDMAKHIIDTGVTVVTPKNAGPFLQDLKEKGIAST